MTVLLAEVERLKAGPGAELGPWDGSDAAVAAMAARLPGTAAAVAAGAAGAAAVIDATMVTFADVPQLVAQNARLLETTRAMAAEREAEAGELRGRYEAEIAAKTQKMARASTAIPEPCALHPAPCTAAPCTAAPLYIP